MHALVTIGARVLQPFKKINQKKKRLIDTRSAPVYVLGLINRLPGSLE